jgi:hypothetical protein
MKKFHIASFVIVAIITLPASLRISGLLAVPLSGVLNAASASIGYSPEDSVDTIYDEREKRAFSSFLRVGFAAPSMIYMMDKDLKYYYNTSWGLMADCFFFKKRNRLGNGLDIGARFTYRNFKIGDDIQKARDDLLYGDNRVHMMSWDITFRGVYGVYFLHELWQFYILGAPRFLLYHSVMKDSRIGDPDKKITLASIGFVGGAGVEVTLFSLMAIFAEYNIGYTPVGRSSNNVEGHQVYVGLVWRTLGLGQTGYW